MDHFMSEGPSNRIVTLMTQQTSLRTTIARVTTMDGIQIFRKRK